MAAVRVDLLPRVDLFPVLTKPTDKMMSEFVHEYKAKLKHSTLPGVVCSAGIATDVNTGATLGKATAFYAYAPWRTFFFGKLNTAKDATLTATYMPASFPGLSARVSGNVKHPYAFVEVGADYQTGSFSTSVAAEIGKPQGVTANASFVVPLWGPWLAFGASGKYLLANDGVAGGLKQSELVLKHAYGPYEGVAFHRIDASPKDDVVNRVGIAALHRVSQFLYAGWQFTYDINKPHDKPVSALAVRWRPSEDTVVLAKYDTTGKLDMSVLAAHWNSDTTLKLSAGLDTRDPSKGMRMGFGLTFGEANIHLDHNHAGKTVTRSVAVIPGVVTTTTVPIASIF